MNRLAAERRHHGNRQGRSEDARQAVLTGNDAGAVFKTLIGHAQHDAAFAEKLRTHYLDEQRQRDRARLDRAIARGELPADTDVPAAVDLLVGPIYHRILMTGDPVDEAFVDTLVEHSVSGYGAR